MSILGEKFVTLDNRKTYPHVYEMQQDEIKLVKLPRLNYIFQVAICDFDMNMVGRPEPIDKPLITWKIVNELKAITREYYNFTFKVMPHEIVWHAKADEKMWEVTHMIHIPNRITYSMYLKALRRVERKINQRLPEDYYFSHVPVTCLQKLHVGHYKDTIKTFFELVDYAEQKGYTITGDRTEIYLTPPLSNEPPEKWETIVRLEVEDV